MMLVNVKTDQKFLALVYELQRNNSNATLYPKSMIRAFVDEPVKCKWDNEEKCYRYSLESENQKKDVVFEGLTMHSKGRTRISIEKVKEIKRMSSEGCSMRDIAKCVGVGLGTVHKYIIESYIEE